MTITTKAALADELGVTRSRVSQYVKQGLPVRADGKLNRHEALNWLKLNQPGLNTLADRGANRAARLAGQARSKPSKPALVQAPPFEAEHEAAREALAWSYRLHARIVAESVLEAGGSIEVAYAAAHIAHGSVVANIEAVLRHLGHPIVDDEYVDIGLSHFGSVEPDWRDLAERGGLTFDPESCRAYLDARSIEQPYAEPPYTYSTDLTVEDLLAGLPAVDCC